MIVGVGTDVCSVDRLAAALARTPALRQRIFTPAESDLPMASLAARFAAKEAVAKALGRPAGARWTDAEVLRGPGGAPALAVRGYEHLRWHVSLAHDAGIATAVVIAEERG
jgi:holo-[acyl-carrier protein] synthase